MRRHFTECGNLEVVFGVWLAPLSVRCGLIHRSFAWRGEVAGPGCSQTSSHGNTPSSSSGGVLGYRVTPSFASKSRKSEGQSTQLCGASHCWGTGRGRRLKVWAERNAARDGSASLLLQWPRGPQAQPQRTVAKAKVPRIWLGVPEVRFHPTQALRKPPALAPHWCPRQPHSLGCFLGHACRGGATLHSDTRCHQCSPPLSDRWCAQES